MKPKQPHTSTLPPDGHEPLKVKWTGIISFLFPAWKTGGRGYNFTQLPQNTLGSGNTSHASSFYPLSLSFPPSLLINEALVEWGEKRESFYELSTNASWSDYALVFSPSLNYNYRYNAFMTLRNHKFFWELWSWIIASSDHELAKGNLAV